MPDSHIVWIINGLEKRELSPLLHQIRYMPFATLCNRQHYVEQTDASCGDTPA